MFKISNKLLCLSILIFNLLNCADLKHLKKIKNENFIEFNESMESNSAFYQKKYKINKNKNYLNKLKNLYEKNNLKNIKIYKKPLIEKNIHQIWLGRKPLPSAYKKLQKSWKEMHPDWNYYLWTDNEVKELKLINQKFFDETEDPIEKANILRYELLYQFGGLYADLDMECLKSFEILHHSYEFYTGIEQNVCPPVLNNALIGCHKGNPIIYHCIKTIENDWHHSKRIHRSGVFHFSKSFEEVLNFPGLKVALPMSYFYPFPGFLFINNEIPYLKEKIKKIKKSKSFAIHYYKSSASLNKILEAADF